MTVLPARGRVAALVVLAATVMVACREKSNRNVQSPEAPQAESAQPAFAGDGRVGLAPKAATRVDVAMRSARADRRLVRSAAWLPTSNAGMLIRSGDVSIQVDSLQRSIDAIRGLAASLGGYVGSIMMNTGEHQVHSATLGLQVPAARFDDAMSGVKPLGTVERSTATAEDVGEEFVDVSARIANGRRLEERLVHLLATRTGKLEDVLAVERELARVREDIERMEGRVRYLSTRMAMSTITVTVHEKAPLVATTPGTNIMWIAVEDMWRNMVSVVAFGIQSLGLVIPPFVIAAVVWVVWRRARRRPLAVSPQTG